jgi:hypothetical protein
MTLNKLCIYTYVYDTGKLRFKQNTLRARTDQILGAQANEPRDSSHATRLGFVSRIGQENVQVAAIVTDGAMLRAPPLTTTRHCFAISAGA